MSASSSNVGVEPFGLAHGDAEPLGRAPSPAERASGGRGRAGGRGGSAGRRRRGGRRAARARRRRTARSPPRRCAGQALQDGLRPQARERLAARLLRRAVEDQDAVEVVELVLATRAREPLELERTTAPRRRPVPRGGPSSRARPARARRGARGSPPRRSRARRLLGDDRVDDARSVAARGPAANDEPPRAPRLVAARPTPLASRISAIMRSARRPQVLVELLDLVRAHPQRRVGVLADLREREPAPRRVLGVALVLDGSRPRPRPRPQSRAR